MAALPSASAGASGSPHYPVSAAAATANDAGDPGPRHGPRGGGRLALPNLVVRAPPTAGPRCRRVSRLADGGRVTTAVTSYDSAGRPVLRSASAGDGSPAVLAWRYDSQGRLTDERVLGRGAAGGSVTYEYSASGRRTTASYDVDGDGRTDVVFAYDYDFLRRLSRFTQDEDVDGVPDWITVHEYDLEGRVQRTTETVPDLFRAIITYTWRGSLLVRRQADPTGYGDLVDTTTYAYDGAGRLVREILDAATNGSADTDFEYEYGPAGRLAARHLRNLGVWRNTRRFTMDGLGRLTAETFVAAGPGGYTKTVAYSCPRVLRSQPRRPGDDTPPAIDPIPDGAGRF